MSTEVSSVTGVRTDRGFEISFSAVNPGDVSKIETYDNVESLSQLLEKRVGKPGATELYRSRSVIMGRESLRALFYHGMTYAYSSHYAVCLRPEVLWHLIAHEAGVYVNQHQDECAGFFTTDPTKKKEILIQMVEDDPWDARLSRFRGAFEPFIAADVLRTFLPRFSTTDAEAEVATLLTFADTVSPWYEYKGIMITCGFPKILLAGTVEDWKLLQSSAQALSDMFEGLRPFFSGLIQVIRSIVATVESGEVDEAFWGSMFKYRGASGPAWMDGWLTTFIAHMRGEAATLRTSFAWGNRGDSLKMDDLCDGVNYVDMKVGLGGGQEQKWVLTSGILGVDLEDGFLTPRLGYAVSQLPD